MTFAPKVNLQKNDTIKNRTAPDGANHTGTGFLDAPESGIVRHSLISRP